MDDLNVYPKEFVKPLLICLSYFRNINLVFFDSNTSILRKYWRYVYMIPLFIFYYISFSMYIVKLFTEGLSPFEDADMIPMWLISTQEFLKYIIMVQNREKVRTVVKHLGSRWRTADLTEEQTKSKNSVLKKLNIGQKILHKGAMFLASQYFLLPLAKTLVRTFLLAQEVDLELPFACVYPFAVDNWPKYLGVYAFQIYSDFILLSIYIGTYLLLVNLTAYVSLQFILLQEDLINIKPTNKSKKTKSVDEDEITEHHECSGCTIEQFVKQHQDVLLLTQELNEMFNIIVFMNLLFSTIIICFFAVALKVSTGTTYTVIYFAVTVHMMLTILIMCYCSEMLSESSSGIAASAVKNKWYKGDLRYQNIIRFILMRSQKPCTLTSLNYSPLTMNAFNKVLKTTYSYFSLASQLYDARD